MHTQEQVEIKIHLESSWNITSVEARIVTRVCGNQLLSKSTSKRAVWMCAYTQLGSLLNFRSYVLWLRPISNSLVSKQSSLDWGILSPCSDHVGKYENAKCSRLRPWWFFKMTFKRVPKAKHKPWFWALEPSGGPEQPPWRSRRSGEQIWAGF